VRSERASYWDAKVSLKRTVYALGAGELVEREGEPQDESVCARSGRVTGTRR
jgi:hypothetical protein